MGRVFYKYEWAECFIKMNGIYLPDDTREQSICFSSAKIAFVKGDHKSDWFRTLNNIQAVDPQFSIRIKILELRNMYEVGERETRLLQYNSNFEKYLHRYKKRLDKKYLQSCRNFFTLYRDLVVHKYTRTRFEKEVDSLRPAVEQWLRSKATDLPEKR